ncbi:hypothetical protein [Escherichia albertii]|uniref:hypothetical protein n=1 Tax=Escherichia albertii TaxID=208962 RepID=UPI0026DCEA70|nr:hypothetical protein [Escherichia albertii]WKU80721.1 hypothetical protein MJ90_23520 [Escherichia albertii]
MTSLKTSIKTITYLSDIGCLEIQGASLLVNDADELEELVEDIAARCGRDLRGIEDNPFLPITTVDSLVRVLNAQPMTQERRSLLFIRS